MEQHYRILGWIMLIFSILATLGMIAFVVVAIGMAGVMGAVGHAVSTSATPDPSWAQTTKGMGTMFGLPFGIMAAMGVIGVAGGIIGIVGGWALLARRGWAKVPVIIASILSLPGFPFGTALGVYGLWAMFQTTWPQAWADYTAPKVATPETSS